nr:hypothetical protein [uncultured Flavobacterium sp.]
MGKESYKINTNIIQDDGSEQYSRIEYERHDPSQITQLGIYILHIAVAIAGFMIIASITVKWFQFFVFGVHPRNNATECIQYGVK